MTQLSYHVVIPAAGSGQRVAASIPKQYLRIGNYTILEHTLKIFLDDPRCERIVVVLNQFDQHWSQTDLSQVSRIMTAIGGETRADSVLSGLVALQSECDAASWVLVHDAARPLLSARDRDQLINKVSEQGQGGILVKAVSDTIKQVDASQIIQTPDRQYLRLALTPQMFRLGELQLALTTALSQGNTITDEAQVMEQAIEVAYLEAQDPNFKVTTSADLAYARFLMSK